MEFRYMNNYTGELYRNLVHAITTVVQDMIHHPKCRTIEMLKIVRYSG